MNWILVAYQIVACQQYGCSSSWQHLGNFDTQRSCLIAVEKLKSATGDKYGKSPVFECLAKA
jgi:hypothetical protein